MTKPANAAEATKLLVEAFNNRNNFDSPEMFRAVADYIKDPAFVRVPVDIVESLSNLASNRYVSYIENMKSTKCLGFEYKMQKGCFGEAELDAHTNAAEFLGEHRAFAEAAKMLAASKESSND